MGAAHEALYQQRDSVSVQKTWCAALREGASLKFPHLINYMFLQIVHLPNFGINCAQFAFRPRGNYIYLEFITIVSTTRDQCLLLSVLRRV